MQFGQVIGQVVSAHKQGNVHGLSLLIVQMLDENLKPTSKTVACTDTVNARHGEIVLLCTSSSARMTDRTKSVCTDTSIVAIVDTISSGKKDTYTKF